MSFIAVCGQGSAQYGERGAAARAPGRKLAHAAALRPKRTRSWGGDDTPFSAALPIVAVEELARHQQRRSVTLKAPQRGELAVPRLAACGPGCDAAAHLAMSRRRSSRQREQSAWRWPARVRNVTLSWRTDPRGISAGAARTMR